eukprot:2117032-Amphidinium_carterae.2
MPPLLLQHARSDHMLVLINGCKRATIACDASRVAREGVGLAVHSPTCQTTKDLVTVEDVANSSGEQVA